VECSTKDQTRSMQGLLHCTHQCILNTRPCCFV